MTTKTDVLEKARGFAGLMLGKSGEVRPMISVHLKNGLLNTLSYDGSDTAKDTAIAVVKMARKAGLLDFALILSEAWMATLPKGETVGPDTVRPSLRADKVEVIIAHVVSDDGTTETGVWPIMRDAAGKPSVGQFPKEKAIEKSECWLDEAVK